MKTLNFVYCNLLGIKREVAHTQKQIEELEKIPKRKLIVRLQAVCDEYAKKGYWTHYYLDGIEVAHQQSNDF